MKSNLDLKTVQTQSADHFKDDESIEGVIAEWKDEFEKRIPRAVLYLDKHHRTFGVLLVVGALLIAWYSMVLRVPPVITNSCESMPCENNSLCRLTNDGDSYECICTSGYTGTRCEHSCGFTEREYEENCTCEYINGYAVTICKIVQQHDYTFVEVETALFSS